MENILVIYIKNNVVACGLIPTQQRKFEKVSVYPIHMYMFKLIIYLKH